MKKELSMLSRSDSEFFELVTHMCTQGLVMPVEGGATLGLGPSFELAGCGEQWSDDFVAQDKQSTRSLQALRYHFVATGGFELAHEVFDAKLLQVICGVTRAIFVLTLATEGANLGSQFRGGKAKLCRRKRLPRRSMRVSRSW
jgi:hypothetical protein